MFGGHVRTVLNPAWVAYEQQAPAPVVTGLLDEAGGPLLDEAGGVILDETGTGGL